MGRQRQVCCKVCFRIMRSDKLLIHMNVHEKHQWEEELEYTNKNDGNAICKDIEIGIDNAVFSENSIQPTMEIYSRNQKYETMKEELTMYLMKNYQECKEKFELGEMLHKIIGVKGISEESLDIAHKEALTFYVKMRMNINVKDLDLRTWQKDLMLHLHPTDREVIWVRGAKCEEGKLWFQEHGWNRVVCGMVIKIKKSNICHSLRNRPLTTIQCRENYHIAKRKLRSSREKKIKDRRILAD